MNRYQITKADGLNRHHRLWARADIWRASGLGIHEAAILAALEAYI